MHALRVKSDSRYQLRRIVKEQVSEVLRQCKDLVVLNPCLGPLGFGRCEAESCRRSHDPPNAALYNTRVSIQLLMIVAFNTTRVTERFWEQRHVIVLVFTSLLLI